ncbi:MAG TPA: hypothetical protein VFG54_07240 [Prolixibacteraceae bacterium]|nr:hypothetical protein [Prolixibacteraceae bacterium]
MIYFKTVNLLNSIDIIEGKLTPDVECLPQYSLDSASAGLKKKFTGSWQNNQS